jgi:glycosyltransferase involved in cell wall biosynthesis
MKIALIGTRGIPAAYGGFETCVEEIGQRLVKKGHQVWVYSKKTKENANLRMYMGMKIIIVPRIAAKGFETLFSTLMSVIHSLFFPFDMHMVFNGANSPPLFIYKLFNKKYALNTDGLEWMRDKWGFIGKNYYKLSERIAVLTCKNLVSDSQGIHDYFIKKYNVESTIIAYGAYIPHYYPEKQENNILNELGIERKKYILQITRFEPENNPLLTLQAFSKMQTAIKCVIIGGANYQSSYLEQIWNEKRLNDRIILPGFIYNKEKLEIIWKNSLLYVHGNSVGGTNPALLQAMAVGRPVLALDCIFNRETLSEHGYFFKRNMLDLLRQIQFIIEHSEEADKKAGKALEKVKEKYNWDLITNQYEGFFQYILNQT